MWCIFIYIWPINLHCYKIYFSCQDPELLVEIYFSCLDPALLVEIYFSCLDPELLVWIYFSCQDPEFLVEIYFDWKYFLRLIRVSGVLAPEKKRLLYVKNVDTSLVSFGPLNNTIVNIDLNKPWIISNSVELSDLEHLPTKTEYIKYLHIASTCTSGLFGPIKQHYIRFEWALDHEKWLTIEWSRVSCYENRIYKISPDRGHAHLSSLWAQ